MVEAQWKIPGLYNADATAVANEIIPLTEEGNTAEKMVEAARSEKSAMHDLFEWDDSIAGQKYRIEQAHGILRTLTIVRPEVEEKPAQSVRFFVSTGERTGTYKQTVKMVQNENEYERLLERAKMELIAFRQKYKSLKEFAELFEVIDEATA